VSTHWTDRLSDFQDGELSPADHTACEAHLAECDECRTVLQELRLVTVIARSDREREPATDLWPGVLARIGRTHTRPLNAETRPHNERTAEVVAFEHPGDRTSAFGSAPAGPSAQSPRRISFSVPQLALAASLLIAVSAGVAYVAAGRNVVRPTSREAPILAMAETLSIPSADVAPANFADAQFDKAVSDLEQILLQQRETLDPRTVVVIERNLRLIDEAIRQARAALDADPANMYLNSYLAEARRRKLDLLRRATSLSGD
jgi:anti-sigma factor RsiW